MPDITYYYRKLLATPKPLPRNNLSYESAVIRGQRAIEIEPAYLMSRDRP